MDTTKRPGERPEDAAARALCAVAFDFTAPRKVREGRDLHGAYVEFEASRLSGREFESVKVRS